MGGPCLRWRIDPSVSRCGSGPGGISLSAIFSGQGYVTLQDGWAVPRREAAGRARRRRMADRATSQYRGPVVCPGLFDLLRQVRKRSPRTVRDLRPALPGASFVEEYVPTGVIRRAEWFAQSKDALRGKETIFLDPDNGIASGKLATGSKRAMKSVFMTEIKSLHQAGHSLVIYHHATRWQKGVTVPQQAAQLAERLHQSGAQTVLPVISRRGTVRIFLVTNVNLACRAAVGHFAERWRDNIDPVEQFVADGCSRCHGFR